MLSDFFNLKYLDVFDQIKSIIIALILYSIIKKQIEEKKSKKSL